MARSKKNASTPPVVPDRIPVGYYVVTRDVTNPRPDRRSQGFDSVPVWKKGTVVKLVYPNGPESIVGEIRPSRGYAARVLFLIGKLSAADVRFHAQGNELALSLEPAPPCLGHILRDAHGTAEQIIALLIERGNVSLESVTAVIRVLQDMDDHESEALDARHGL